MGNQFRKPSLCQFDAIFAEKVPGKALFARVRPQNHLQKLDLAIPESPLKLQLPVSSAFGAIMSFSEVLFYFHTCILADFLGFVNLPYL